MQSKFTDKELELLKENLATDDYVMHDIFDDNDLTALLHRLECAEAYIADPWHDNKIAWLKSKGESQ